MVAIGEESQDYVDLLHYKNSCRLNSGYVIPTIQIVSILISDQVSLLLTPKSSKILNTLIEIIAFICLGVSIRQLNYNLNCT